LESTCTLSLNSLNSTLVTELPPLFDIVVLTVAEVEVIELAVGVVSVAVFPVGAGVHDSY
jgi:hypothetical protein